MEERNKILTNLRMNNSRRHHYHDSNHSNTQPHHMTTTQSDSEDEECNSRDPLLQPVSTATPTLFPTITTDVLSSSPTSQLSM